MAQLNSLIVTGDSRFLNTINGNITSTNAIHRATMETSSTATAFVLTADGIDSLYDGLIITCKNTKIASASGCTINLNGLGAKSIWLSQNNSACTTHWGLNHTYFFIYDEANSRWELQQGRDTDGNDTSTLHSYYSRPTVDTNGIKQYSLFAYTSGLKVSSFTTNNGTGTKTFNTTNYFDIRKIFYYNGSGNVAAGAKLGNNTMSLNENLVDMRYTFNGVTTDASTSSLVAEKPVFICFDLADMTSSNFANTSCLAKLKSPYITQEMNDRGTLYVLVGYMHDSYRCSLIMDNLTYAYGPAGFNCFTTSDASNYSVSAKYAGTVNGHTVDKDVPSNAVFTDHTYTGTGLISVNASTGVISTTATANTGTITSVKTTAGAHTAINVTSGAANFNVPTKTSHLTNDSGFITSYVTAGNAGTTTGTYATVEGKFNYATGEASHAEGEGVTSSGVCSHAEGVATAASGKGAHAEGTFNPDVSQVGPTASGAGSHAEGFGVVTASNNGSHAEGLGTIASGIGSHSEGANTIANNYGSHAEGYYTIASSTIQHVAGKFNVVDNNETYARIIGGGSSDSDRKNILTTDWYGNIQCGFNSPYKAMGGAINGIKIIGKHAETSVKSVRLFWPVSNDFSFCGFILLRKAVYFLSISTSSSDGSVTYKWCQKVAGDTTPITGTSVVTSGKITDRILGACTYIEIPLAADKWTQVQFILTSYNGLTHPSSRVDGYLNKLHMSYVDDSGNSPVTICDYDNNQNNIY